MGVAHVMKGLANLVTVGIILKMEVVNYAHLQLKIALLVTINSFAQVAQEDGICLARV